MRNSCSPYEVRFLYVEFANPEKRLDCLYVLPDRSSVLTYFTVIEMTLTAAWPFTIKPLGHKRSVLKGDKTGLRRIARII